MKVTIKPACYTINKAYMDNIPIIFHTGLKPSDKLLPDIQPTGNPRIVFIPFNGWPVGVLATQFRWCREHYDSHSVRRQDIEFNMREVLRASNPHGYLEDETDAEQVRLADEAIEMLGESIKSGLDREQNPVVELIPWRYCRFVFINNGAETWLDFDGTLIVPIVGNPDATQKRVLSGVVRDYYFRVLKNMKVYPEESNPEITIGLDPEVSVYRVVSGKGRISEHILAREVIGSRNCDLKIGTDGCDSIFEFRPDAGSDISKVVDSVESCVKGLAYKLMRSGYSKVYGVVGGGCSHSLGGHIHIGNERIKKLSQADLKQLGQMLDDFLYYPIRDRMTGAIRSWIHLPSVSQQTFGGPIPTFEHLEDAKDSLKEIKRFGRSTRFAGYDHPSQWRQKSYGYEYRSLPSFIVNKEFTKCVLEMTQIIASKFYELCNNGTAFEYNSPCAMKDYLLLFPKELAVTFHHYINGDKREIFMDNLFANWGIKNAIYERYVSVLRLSNGGWGERNITKDEDDLTDISEQISRRFHSLLRYAYKDGNIPGRILFQATASGNANFSVHSRALIVNRNSTQGAPLDYNAICSNVGSVIVQHGSSLRKGGMIHCVKQALIMDLFYRVGRTAPRRYERMCEIIRKWHPESENTYGPIITAGFTPLNQG